MSIPQSTPQPTDQLSTAGLSQPFSSGQVTDATQKVADTFSSIPSSVTAAHTTIPGEHPYKHLGGWLAFTACANVISGILSFKRYIV